MMLYIYVSTRVKTYVNVKNMSKGKKLEKSTKSAAIFVIIAFITGTMVGYAAHDLISPAYQFEVGENLLQNSGFEDGMENEPVYWYQAIIPADNLTLSWDDEIKYNGSRSVSINNTHIYNETVCNNWAQTTYKVPKGRIIELSGWVKTIDAESVVMVIQCWNILDEMVAFGTTQTTTEINGTTEWQMYNASVFVPNETNNIVIRLVLTGAGQVWFDDITLVVK